MVMYAMFVENDEIKLNKMSFTLTALWVTRLCAMYMKSNFRQNRISKYKHVDTTVYVLLCVFAKPVNPVVFT